ncbi:hypothetical protein NPIL_252331 [Nephila pilipes]|uniref:DUF4817 domain-containing protein n=1 Tax=Nephila pilipes TaxID=299642 RepID=A0A8X6N5B0_NEPPI|nr:hypothetical protein NPIL_252331 [Nephila pilipes]
MHLENGAADCNGRAVQRLYAQRYPRRKTPSHAFFALLRLRFQDRGFLIADKKEWHCLARSPDLTCIDYCLWGNNAEDLVVRIAAIAEQSGTSSVFSITFDLQ